MSRQKQRQPGKGAKPEKDPPTLRDRFGQDFVDSLPKIGKVTDHRKLEIVGVEKSGGGIWEGDKPKPMKHPDEESQLGRVRMITRFGVPITELEFEATHYWVTKRGPTGATERTTRVVGYQEVQDTGEGGAGREPITETREVHAAAEPVKHYMEFDPATGEFFRQPETPDVTRNISQYMSKKDWKEKWDEKFRGKKYPFIPYSEWKKHGLL
ncbi:hypothetical protein ACFLRC_02130 [Candidatus Altiarchaeota archaeon]